MEQLHLSASLKGEYSGERALAAITSVWQSLTW
jgi:hypothetical protein